MSRMTYRYKGTQSHSSIPGARARPVVRGPVAGGAGRTSPGRRASMQHSPHLMYGANRFPYHTAKGCMTRPTKSCDAMNTVT